MPATSAIRRHLTVAALLMTLVPAGLAMANDAELFGDRPKDPEPTPPAAPVEQPKAPEQRPEHREGADKRREGGERPEAADKRRDGAEPRREGGEKRREAGRDRRENHRNNARRHADEFIEGLDNRKHEGWNGKDKPEWKGKGRQDRGRN